MSDSPEGLAAPADGPVAPQATEATALTQQSDGRQAGSRGIGWRLRHPLEVLLGRQLTRAVTRTQAENLRLFWLDGFWASASEGFWLSYIPLFALAYGATAAELGLIASVGNLTGALALLPGARILDWTGQRKPVVVWSSLVGRLALLCLALLPFLGPAATVAVLAIMVLNAVRSFGFNFANPAWTSMSADLVPIFMRGRYFSLRNFLMGIATLIAPPAAGWIIAWGKSGAQPLRGYQWAFLIAFITGMASTWYFSRLREPAMHGANSGEASRRSLGAILRSSRALTVFVVSAFVWNLSLQIASPYFNVYLVTGLGGTETTVGIVTALSALTGLVGLVFFGRILDRRGTTWVYLVTGLSITVLPMAWAFYTNAFEVAVNNLLGGFLWAGFNLATFNLLLLLTPDDQRARAVALFQLAVFGGSVIGPLVGGFLADNAGFPTAFMVSGIGRLVAMLIFVGFGARSARKHERELTA